MRYQVIPLIFATAVVAASARAGDTRIVDEKTQTIRFVIAADRVIPTDAYGRKQFNKPYYTNRGRQDRADRSVRPQADGRDTLEVKRGK